MTRTRRTLIRFARGDFDKPHRCPGVSGPGWTRGDGWCDGVTPEGNSAPRWAGADGTDGIYRPGWQWRTRRTTCCDTIVLPDVLRWAEPFTWRVAVGNICSAIRYRWQAR